MVRFGGQAETLAPSTSSQNRCSLFPQAPRRIASPRRGATVGGRIMEFPRRAFLHLALGAAALPAIPRMARAQAPYPSRPVRIIVGAARRAIADLVDGD